MVIVHYHSYKHPFDKKDKKIQLNLTTIGIEAGDCQIEFEYLAIIYAQPYLILLK